MEEDKPEQHPAWGLIGASRVRSTPGTVLFDSDLRHQHFIMVRIGRAQRRRDLHHDHIYKAEDCIEVSMSEAQWASFVSTMNVGDGVPCTIDRVAGEQMPEPEHEPRLAESMDEVRDQAAKSLAQIKEKYEAYREKKSAANLRSLEFAIKNAPANMAFAAESLTEHAENVVQRARADIEAMVLTKAKHLGIEPGELGEVLQIEEGHDDNQEGGR